MTWAVPCTGVSAGILSGLVGLPTWNAATRFHVDRHLVSNLITSSLRSFPDVDSVCPQALDFTKFTLLFIYYPFTLPLLIA